jgi:hypothetical protein
MPLLASEQVKVTVTSSLPHPAALSKGEKDAVIVGGVVSGGGGITTTSVLVLVPGAESRGSSPQAERKKRVQIKIPLTPFWMKFHFIFIMVAIPPKQIILHSGQEPTPK